MQLYSQQEEALKALRNFVESDISVFILKGYAGTGKTTMINIFCKELSKYNKCVKLMAPTGRAAKVLREKQVGMLQLFIRPFIVRRNSKLSGMMMKKR